MIKLKIVYDEKILKPVCQLSTFNTEEIINLQRKSYCGISNGSVPQISTYSQVLSE